MEKEIIILFSTDFKGLIMAILEDMRDEFRSSILEYIQDNDCSLDEITEQVPHITIGTLYSILDELEEEQEVIHDVEQDVWSIHPANL